MQLELDTTQIADARTALLGENSTQLIEFIFRLNLNRSLVGVSEAAVAEAIRLGWVDTPNRKLTQIGWLVADAIREYRFWLDRGRRIHGESEYDLLASEKYQGLSVLELGSGFGCNLLSLSQVKGHFVGLEPVHVYRQLTSIFADREGLPMPEVVEGTAEALPFADCDFDVVLCYSSHQYMDIRPALREMARVLRPGGQLQIIGGTLDHVASGMGMQLLKSPSVGALRRYLLTVGNTLSYEYLNRRLHAPRGFAATTAPIYPRYRFMRHWIHEVELTPREELCRRIGGDTCFIADKPAKLKAVCHSTP